MTGVNDETMRFLAKTLSDHAASISNDADRIWQRASSVVTLTAKIEELLKALEPASREQS